MLLSFVLQHLKRTGWVNNNVQDPETVAGHMYRMAMMCFLFGGEGSGSATAAECQPVDRERSKVPNINFNTSHDIVV